MPPSSCYVEKFFCQHWSQSDHFFYKQKTAYEITRGLEFRRVPSDLIVNSWLYCSGVRNCRPGRASSVHMSSAMMRSEERRVGKECRSPRLRYHKKKKEVLLSFNSNFFNTCGL